MRRGRFLIASLAVLAIVTDPAGNAPAQQTGPGREDQFKAAYLFNFVKFVEWPASAAPDVLTVCFLGADAVHDALALDIDKKRVGARRLAVRRLQVSASSDGCNVLYLDASVALDKVLTVGANALSILTVSNAESFTHNGGMIELFTDSNRLRFRINIDTAQRAGLHISSSLLQLAAAVERDGKR